MHMHMRMRMHMHRHTQMHMHAHFLSEFRPKLYQVQETSIRNVFPRS